MKRSLRLALLLISLVMIAVVCTACGSTKTQGNRAISGQDIQTFNYAYVMLDGNTIVEGYIMQWRDYKDSDVIQLLVNGKYYLTHYSNVVMIADPAMSGLEYGHETLQDN